MCMRVIELSEGSMVSDVPGTQEQRGRGSEPAADPPGKVDG
jgi:hypothetical protein